jgi:hypothetical protein
VSFRGAGGPVIGSGAPLAEATTGQVMWREQGR